MPDLLHAPVILEVQDLSINYITTEKILLKAVENVSFSVREGEILGLVGESGCGKTTLMLALLQLLPFNGRIVSGQMLFKGRNLAALGEEEMAKIRWKDIAMIFQGAMNALNPVKTIGFQIDEAITCHDPLLSHEKRHERVGKLLEIVGITAERMQQFPFQFSCGMRQRAMIAMALACSPQLLIADEPTTALDVMIQAQILELMLSLRDKLGQALILVTHDLGVVAELCDTVLVMYGGVAAEYSDVDTIYNHPAHPYTQCLLKAFPDISHQNDKLLSIPGYPPRLDDLPPGCRFAPRCPQVFERCLHEQPSFYEVGPRHYASCFLVI
jgi:oligopeptide/dipeptide ABC transporter ATP-binding protein